MTSSSWQQTDSDNSSMRLHLSAPDGAGPFPAMVVIQHQGGVDEFVRNMTERLAGAGYLSVAPDLYHRDGPDCKDDLVDPTVAPERPKNHQRHQRHSRLLTKPQRGRRRERLGLSDFAWAGGWFISWLPPCRHSRQRSLIIRATFFARGDGTCRRRSNGARKFIVRSRATLVPTMAIRRPKTWRSSTPNSKSSKSRMNFIPTPMPAMRLWIARKKVIAATPTKLPGRELSTFWPGIWPRHKEKLRNQTEAWRA